MRTLRAAVRTLADAVAAIGIAGTLTAAAVALGYAAHYGWELHP